MSTNTRATADPRLVDVDHEVVEHGPVDSLEEAARKRSLPRSAVLKTMVVRRSDDDYVFVLVPGDRVIDWAKLRGHLKQRRLSMPDADEAHSVTGYTRGTITPLGSTHDWPVLGDQRLLGSPVSIGGGQRGVSITIDGQDLVRILNAETGDFTKPTQGADEADRQPQR